MNRPLPVVAPAAVRHFVRDILGCTCPDAVFERIESAPGDNDLYRQSIAVGGRLLVLVAEAHGAAGLDRQVDELLVLGRRWRDGDGFNRLRLVLLSDSPARIESRALARFMASAERDERTHLHCLPNSSLP